jgi:DNA-binding transcriptional LysR family regulator
MINDLEKEWGVNLLERNRSGLRLTSDGLNLFPSAKRLFEEYRNLQHQIEEINGLQSGVVRIGTFSSVATHWLPKIIKRFQTDYPNIEFELLLGDYHEIEKWISEGRVDFGFLRLPTLPELETKFIEQDNLIVILPENHPLVDCDKFPIAELSESAFILLEKESNSDITKLFKKWSIDPKIRFTTWDDYAIMAMVESGLGISILPQLILQRISYNIVTKELEVPAFRKIGLAYREKQFLSLAGKKFLEYLDYRHE